MSALFTSCSSSLPPCSVGSVCAIAAVSYPSMGLGNEGRLPWSLGEFPVDQQLFKQLTTNNTTSKAGGRVEHNKRINAVVMGRKTWDSLPAKRRPLSGRLNIVITRRHREMIESQCRSDSLCVCGNLDEALKLIREEYAETVERTFIIGGSEVYSAAFSSGMLSRIYLTRVNKNFPSDTFLPQISSDQFTATALSPTHRNHNDIGYDFLIYDNIKNISSQQPTVTTSATTTAPGISTTAGTSCGGSSTSNGHVVATPANSNGNTSDLQPAGCEVDGEPSFLESLFGCRRRPVPLDSVICRNHAEFQYLDAIRDILATGSQQSDRTGVGIISKFGCQMRYNLRETFPLLTTKRVYWKGVVEELLWLIRGDTNATHLSDVNVKIWDKNATREFLDAQGLHHRQPGDLGPVYGFQWRHFGAEYKDMHTDYSGQGKDQLAECLHKIKHNPTDRRIILSAWNPKDLSQMALPPCHMFCQFYVCNGELSCQMYQRSCDMGLGVPFNIASYALLTILMAHVCGLKPGDFVHCLGNAHVYLTHVEPLRQQLTRLPQPFPIVKLNEAVTDISEFTMTDIQLLGYSPLDKIAMEMAV
eukprot:GHVS01056329.1.p1 GENE.GHVS01056329.1~~GHVS01056329.1.p1  ORF type:complete len:587 (-),score=71.89 GHVS01056329.1:196-1956(-)